MEVSIMAVTVNGTTLTSMTYNGQAVNTWIHNGVQVFSVTKYLYSGTANEGNFKKYPCILTGYIPQVSNNSGTLTIGSSLTYKSTLIGYSVVSDAVDLTNYKYLRFTHTSATGGIGFGESNYVVFFIAKTISQNAIITPLKKQVLLGGKNGTASGDITIDISSLTGDCYIGVMCQAESATDAYAQVSFSNMRLTNT